MGESNVNRFRLMVFLCGLLSIAVASVASAQDWPLPASSPNTPVPCTGCLGKSDLLTPGYPPVLGYVGRFADAEYIVDLQAMFRTGRPRGAFLAPDRNRLYLMLGSSLDAYNLDTFFTRVAKHEALSGAQGVPTTPSNANWRSAGSELFLWWDKFFYAEHGGGWFCPIQDGQDRILRNGVDWDDRGICYLAYTLYGWGMVRDDGGGGGGWMDHDNVPTFTDNAGNTQLNYIPSNADNLNFESILSVKTSTNEYYALVGDLSAAHTQVWNVTNRNRTPVRLADRNDLSLVSSAKDTSKSRIAILQSNGQVKLYNADDLVDSRRTPILTAVMNGGKYYALDSDGKNFYLLGRSGFYAYITVLALNSSGGYDRKPDFLVTDDANVGVVFTPQGIHVGGGVVAVFGSESAPLYSWNVRLFKVAADASAIAPISTDVVVAGKRAPFFAQYYGTAAPSGYTHPFYNIFMDVLPYKYTDSTGKTHTYLVVANLGLGDVWELKSGDDANASLKAVAETANPNSKGTTPGPFYGDRQTFTASLTSGTPTTMNWTFDDSTSGTTLPGTTDIKHQFGGVTNIASLPVTRHATAVNAADTTMQATVPVTLAKPSTRFALAGTNFLFSLPNASSTAPIVTNDLFVDGSDGSVEGHFAEWVRDNAATRALPSDTFPVGTCGVHTVNFIGHYGAYTGTGASLSSVGADLPSAINGFVYVSRPFAVSVQPPDPVTPATATLPAVFAASVRPSSGADLPAGAATPADYLWELVSSTGTILQSDHGTRTLGTIPTFSVSRTLFAGGKVRLTVSVASTAVSTGCAPYKAMATLTDAFYSPDPVIPTPVGCANAGAPCSITVTSALNPSQSGWAYAWTLTKAGNVVTTATTQTFAPAITTGGAYLVSLTVTNAISSATASTTINPAQPLCGSAPSVDNTNFGIGGCASAICHSGEAVSFTISAYQYTLDPACDTATWNFGDNSAPGSGLQTTHTYASNGTYSVTLTLVGGSSTAIVTKPVTIGSVVQPNPNPNPNPNPDPNPQPSGSCPAQNANSAYIGLNGAQSSCNGGATPCKTGETISFGGYSLSYDFNCNTTSYLWNFGDNSSASDRLTQHMYTLPGTYHVTLTISNNGGSGVYSATVQVGGGTNAQCGTLSTQTISFGWLGSGCTQAGGDCVSTTPVSFSAIGVGYDLSCGTHTYEWDYGDSSTHGTAASSSHSYSKAGVYTVKLTVGYGTSSITLSNTVHVTAPSGGGSCPLMVADENVYIVYFGNQCPSGGASCGVGESLQFRSFFYNYDFGCSDHTYRWDFGDNRTSVEKDPIHAYTQGGTYRVKLTISNNTQSIDLFKTVVVAGAPAGPPRGGRAVRH